MIRWSQERLTYKKKTITYNSLPVWEDDGYVNNEKNYLFLEDFGPGREGRPRFLALDVGGLGLSSLETSSNMREWLDWASAGGKERGMITSWEPDWDMGSAGRAVVLATLLADWPGTKCLEISKKKRISLVMKKRKRNNLGALIRPAGVIMLELVRKADRTGSCPVVTPTLVI